MNKIKIIAACCNTGQRKLGVELGPINILSKMIMKKHSDIHIINDKKFKTIDGYLELYNQHINMGTSKILTLGGDHSISAFSIASSILKYGDKLKIIWIDAHEFKYSFILNN